MGDPPKYQLDTLLVDVTWLIIIIRPMKGFVVNDRKKRKTDIGQQKKIRQAVPQCRGLSFMMQIIKIDDQPKHKHGTQDGQNCSRPGNMDPTNSQGSQHETKLNDLVLQNSLSRNGHILRLSDH